MRRVKRREERGGEMRGGKKMREEERDPTKVYLDPDSVGPEEDKVS